MTTTLVPFHIEGHVFMERLLSKIMVRGVASCAAVFRRRDCCYSLLKPSFVAVAALFC